MPAQETFTENPGYIVVLRYTREAGGYAGVMFWTSYPTKAEFDEWLAAGGDKEERVEVVEHGITDKRAMELTAQTPFASYINAALQDSFDPESGKINGYILEMKIVNAVAARESSWASKTNPPPLEITFEWNEKRYAVDMDSYREGGPIVLPDNTMLEVGMWEEVHPPHPVNITAIQELSLGKTPEETAKIVGGTVAREI